MITLDTVIGEIKDERSRRYVDNSLPYQLTVKNTATWLEQKDMDLVQNFAKDTGDYSSLSLVDSQVIAMGVKIARQKDEQHLIKKEP